jgi:hypothetical protein
MEAAAEEARGMETAVEEAREMEAAVEEVREMEAADTAASSSLISMTDGDAMSSSMSTGF